MSVSPLEDLAVAIERGNARRVESLIRSGSVDVNARLPRAFKPPPLVLAAEQRPAAAAVRIVESLLNAGARIDDVDESGQTACHAAASPDHADVLQALLAHRPNLALRDSRGQTALQVAFRYGFDRIAMALVEAGAPLDGVSRADLCRLAACSVAVVESLMSRGVVISELRGESGETPLHFAVMSESCSLALLFKLIACGVDLDAFTTGSSHDTCASQAIRQRRADVLCVLLRAGANVNAERFGTQLLELSAMIGCCECALVLLAAGADVTARDYAGMTACIVAAERPRARISGYEGLVFALLAGGSDLDAADNRGSTARQLLAARRLSIDAEQVESARREIAKRRLDFVRYRALEVCIGLQSLRLDALQMCEILQHSCGPLARLIAFHQWWKIATTVKHFHRS